MMMLVGLLLSLLSFLGCTLAIDDGLTDAVSWDRYSLSVNGTRTFIYSAEFHYQRLPVPELWLDVFEKFKANGFNCISVYFFWSYHSPVKDVYDFESGGHDIQQMFDYAKQAGLYVTARAGPYDNAESSAGGLALHLSDGSGGRLRTNDQTYYESWQPWIAKVGQIIADNQITNGGPVIMNQVENELQETTYAANNTLVLYMEQVEQAFRDAGVIVPFTSNEKGERSVSWSTDYNNVGGAVDLYGLDSYPFGATCQGDGAATVLRNYFQWFQNYSFTQPEALPEFQGGYFQPWGASDYNDCTYQLDTKVSELFYKNNIGQRIVIQNSYMAYGGTNWGHSAAPVVFTSYDYSAPLRENRQVRDKLSQIKLLSLFTRVSPGLLHTEMEGNGTSYTSNPAIFTWVIRNTESSAAFYVLQQNVSSLSSVTTDLNVNTSAGPITISNVNLDGRQSKIIVTDYDLGYSTLLYSSADIASWGTFGATDVLVLYSEVGQTSTFAFKGQPQQYFSVAGQPINVTTSTSNTTASYTYSQGSGASIIRFGSTIVYALDTQTAWRFFAAPTTSNPQVLPTEQIFVLGPYLVRSANISDTIVNVVGDNDNSTTIEVYAGEGVDSITWNGEALETSMSSYGSLTASLPGAAPEALADLPELTDWQSADCFPEVSPGYDDSEWIVCNKTTTLSPIAPLSLPVLFSSDYGYYTGIKIYRGRFDATNATSINLTASGGLAFGWNVWLNGALVGTQLGSPANTTTSLLIPLTTTTLLQPTNNLLTVLIDYTGHDETSTAKGVENPRGLLGAVLNGGIFTSWKIQGNAGGAQGAYDLDPVRAPMNEGGLFAERLGWHLPGFDPSNTTQLPPNVSFTPSAPSDGLSKAGVKFYTTSVTLDLPEGHDIPLGIEFSAANGTQARVQLFVNGYQYGKYVPHIGPQVLFPMPEGVLNHRGENRIGISLWAQTDNGASVQDVSLVRFGAYASGFEGFTGNRLGEGLQPGWIEERLQYA